MSIKQAHAENKDIDNSKEGARFSEIVINNGNEENAIESLCSEISTIKKYNNKLMCEYEMLLVELARTQKELEYHFGLLEKMKRSQRGCLGVLFRYRWWVNLWQLRKNSTQIHVIEESDLFDSNWYIHKYPDVDSNIIDPLLHYIKYGANEGRNPSDAFDTNYYLSTNPDVAKSGINPLYHYIKFGRAEGRNPLP